MLPYGSMPIEAAIKRMQDGSGLPWWADRPVLIEERKLMSAWGAQARDIRRSREMRLATYQHELQQQCYLSRRRYEINRSRHLYGF